MVERQLVGRSDRFPVSATAFFWTRVVGGQAGDTVEHVWMHEGKVVESLVLNIGGPHWRTYTRKRVFYEGAWAVEARAAGGAVLARHEFTCTPADG